MSDATLTDIERLAALADADRTFQMTEEAFRVFYEWTARPAWLYLARMTGDARLADDLLQEAYYRFLRSTHAFESDEHRRNYLFRIATNLVHDHRRRPQPLGLDEAGVEQAVEGGKPASVHVDARLDLRRAMGELKPRERELLWLAYGQGFSHQEMASILGVKAGSLKPLLFRARKRLLGLLDGGRSREGRR